MLTHLFALATNIDPGSLPQPSGDEAHLQSILTLVFSIIGGIALLIIVLQGLRYITSGGDPQKAAQAKNGIIFALVGIVVAIAAQAIVSFVVGRV